MIKKFFLVIVLMLSYIHAKAQCDYFDDFTKSRVANFERGASAIISADGWKWNCCRHSANSEELEINGSKTGSYIGYISSPVLSGGCKSIHLSYRAIDGKSLKFEIKQGEQLTWNTTITVSQDGNWYNTTIDDLEIEGDFQLVITNTTAAANATPQGIIYIKDICLKKPATSVATPTFTVSGREKSENLYWESATVDIATTTPDAAIYYTIDGTEPTAESTHYAESFTLPTSATVKAVAIYGDLQSEIADTTVTIAGPQTAGLPFEESFAGSLGDWYSYSLKGEQLWGAGADFAGISGAIDDYTVAENEDWLISPAFTAAEGESIAFSFVSAVQGEGPVLSLRYSTDYAGVGNPATATWTDLSAQAVWAQGGQDRTPSGEIIVTEILPVRFAFVYTSSIDEAARWQIASCVVTAREYTGINTITETTFSFYPNPFVDYIIVNTKSNGIATIYDLSGKPVSTVNVQAGSNRIDAAALSKGVYLLKINESTVKIVK